MKFLYASVEPNQSDELCAKVCSQILGVRQLGNVAESACIFGDELLYCTNDETNHFPLPISSHLRDETVCTLICDYIKENRYDYVYLSGFLIKQTMRKIASYAKTENFGTKVIFEVMSYPVKDACSSLLQTYKQSGNQLAYRKLRSQLIQHAFMKRQFYKVVDSVIVFGFPVERVWNIPAFTVDSGIAVGEIKRRTTMEMRSDPISILGVVEDAETCGYDRMIHGMKIYMKNVCRDKITFDIVGDEADMLDLKQMVGDNNLADCVHFLGKKSIEELGELFNSHTVAVSCLGLYRTGGSYYSSRSTKQYCAAGIPFMYAYEELNLDNDTPFALKLTNNDSPINIPLIGEFVWRCRLNPRLAQIERKFAEQHYDWRVIMKRILEFTATGRREV